MGKNKIRRRAGGALELCWPRCSVSRCGTAGHSYKAVETVAGLGAGGRAAVALRARGCGRWRGFWGQGAPGSRGPRQMAWAQAKRAGGPRIWGTEGAGSGTGGQTLAAGENTADSDPLRLRRMKRFRFVCGRRAAVGPCAECVQQGGDISGVLDGELSRVIDESDIFMVNQEFPFSGRGTAAPDKQFTFRLPTEKVSMFGEMGIDIVTLANNHALDFGTDALVDTLDTLDGAGIPHVGAGRNLDEAKEPVLLEVKGKTIGFLGASQVIPEGSWNATSTRPGIAYDLRSGCACGRD